MVDKERYEKIRSETESNHAQLVVVSKNQNIDDVLELYHLGQRHFGENKVKELITKKELLPADIQWHLIGHLQTNKAKLVIETVHLFHALDSFRLAIYLNELAKLKNIVFPVLIELKVATEKSKKGFSPETLIDSLHSEDWMDLKHLSFRGIMAMASFTDNKIQIRDEFKLATNSFRAIEKLQIFGPGFKEISMGMSGDYKIALEEDSSIVRIGSLLFSPG